MNTDDLARKENTPSMGFTSKLTMKNSTLKQTIQKIVKANNDFLHKMDTINSQTNPGAHEISPFEILPKEVIFEGVSAGLDYFTNFTVTNLTPKQKKIKIKLPKSTFFTFENSETVLIAPGLQFHCKIYYKARTSDELHDTFTVVSDDYSITVPITVYPPRGILNFESGINLGFVQPDIPVNFSFPFSNIGQEPIIIDFAIGDELSLVSESFPLLIGQGNTEVANFEAIFPRPGPIRVAITLNIQGQLTKQYLDLSANVVSYSTILVDEKGNETSILNFEEILLGDERNKKVTVLNNSPKPTQFRIQILKGINNEHYHDQAKPQTPYDLGLELSEQVIFVEPSSGEIEGYGFQILNFKLKTTPTLEEKFIVSKFAISEDVFDQDQLNAKGKRNFNYTAFFSFEDALNQKTLQIFANAFCPLINFSQQHIRFGDVITGSRQKMEIALTNYNSSLPVLITTPKESFLHCKPSQLSLEAKQTKTIDLEFTPKNLGVFDGKYIFKLNKCFDVKIDIVASGISGDTIIRALQQGSHKTGKLETVQSKFGQLVDQSSLMASKQTKQISTPFGRANSMQKNLKETPRQNLPQLDQRKASVVIRPNKFSSQFADLQEPIPLINKNTPALFVLKPVKNNEPNNLRTIGGKFIPDTKLVLKELPSNPKDYEEAKQLAEKLSGEKLMRIQVGPTEINFGKIFVNSSVSQYFQVKNDLWSSISCAINTERIHELRETSQKIQIIPSGKTAGFKITVNSPISKNIREKVSYVINGSHVFHFLVNAEIVPVDLEINKPIMNFKFKEDSLEMTTSDILSLKNTGNSVASFKLRIDNPHSPFKIINPEGIIKENSTKDIEIVYYPSSSKDEETIYLEIEKGGPAKLIKCFGVVNETACDILQPNVNFGNIAVGQKKNATFTIKNSHNKYYTIFKLDESTLPEGVEIRPKCGKVCPEDIQKVDLEFLLRKKAEYKNHEILFQVRGAPPLKVIFSTSTVIPTIEIEQLEFNFDKITFGNKSSLPLDISNKSSIPAELYLNLTSANNFMQEKFDCVEIEYINKSNSDSIVFERLENTAEGSSDKFNQQNHRNAKKIEPEGKINQISTQDILVKATDHKEKFQKPKNPSEGEGEKRTFIFYLKPNRTYNFSLIFSPVKPSLYDFDLVFKTPGQDASRGLSRRVYCMGTNPRFLMEPLNGFIEFARKIIISPESVVAEQKTITISNPSFDEKLVWSLNTSSIDPQSTFMITPSNGVIDPQCTVALKVSFRPLKPLVYDAAIPLYIDNKPIPHSEIKIRGEGSFPKILFSTEEIILPPTPLNVTSYGYIALINDGYQNSNFTAFLPNEYTKLGLALEFLNGNLLGINNQKIFLKISFISSNPVAFTAKVNIEDDLKRTFSFSISGVSDNSLFTYGPFLSLGYFVNSMFRNNLDNFESIQNYDPEFKNCQSITIDSVTKAPKFSIKLDKKVTDFSNSTMEAHREEATQLKDQNGLEDSDLYAIDYYTQVSNSVKCWLLEYGISNIINFPEDLRQTNGLQFYELLEFLLKNPPAKPTIDPNLKNVDRVLAIVQNYYNLLNFLKENNAMVNNVRPYFLLTYKDLMSYYKVNQIPHLVPDYYKITEVQYKLLSLQSWTTLYLQAIKVFFVSRIGAKDFKASLIQLTEKKKKESLPIEDKMEKDPKSKDPSQKKGEVAKAKNNPGQKENYVEIKVSHIQEVESIDKDSSQILNKIMPEYPYDKNSLFSTSEALLLRWLEVLYEMKNKDTLRITNFGKELQNCFVFSSAVDIYTTNESQLCQKVKPSAFLNDEIASNLENYKKVLHEFGIKEEFCDADFFNCNAIGLLLMTVHLFKTLPPYIPRSTIEFNCSLHEKMVKEITLNNPSPKTIIYTVKLFGQKNFGVDNEIIKMEGKQTISIPISFYASTSFPVEGKIFLQNRRNGKSVAGAVVFILKANIVNRFSMRTFTISNVCLYETGNSEISINNPFDKDVDFKIKIENMAYVAEQPVKPKQQKKGSKEEPATVKEEKQLDFLPSFFIKQDRLWIRKGSSAKLYVQYLPITFENHRCLLIFLDPKIGEMQYEIIGMPKPPMAIDNFKISVPIENLTNVELSIPSKNSMFSSALMKLSDKIKESKEFSYLPIIEKMNANTETIFDIELQPSEFLTCQSPVILGTKPGPNLQKTVQVEKLATLQNNQTGPISSNKQIQSVSSATPNSQISKLVLIPMKKVPFKDLHIKICLRGKQKFDHRFYDLFFTVLPKTIKATIEIKTTARIPVTQNIPISNNTEFECTIKPSFHPIINGHLFDIPLSLFQIKKKSFINFPLKFSSNWIEKAEGRLTLFNTTTNDNFEYLIKVDCEEPLSENHEEIYTKAKKKTEIILKVKNPLPESKSFRVDCDIPDAEYLKKVAFEDAKSIDYKINFLPIIGGSFMYSITFTDDSGKYFWYLVTVHVDSPEPMKIMAISTEIRKPTACKIEIENPTDKKIFYKIVMMGEFLSGDSGFEIQPKSKEYYFLYYFPLKIENIRKKIGFLSDEEGEIWYDIDCRSEESKIVKLATFKAELGKSINQQISFKNPLKKKSVFVSTDQEDNSNFVVTPKKFEIKPNESFQVDIKYTPRDLNKNETEQLTFYSNEIGDWKYQLFGIGIPPTEFESTSISTALGKPVTKTFIFKNPFNHETSFNIFVDPTDCHRDLFEMLFPKQKNTIIAGLGSVQIIVKFNPTEIFTYKARLIVKINDNLQWVYPIVGITEAIQNYSEFNIKTKCGVESETVNKYKLVGITNLLPDEVFEYSFKINHKESTNIEKWLKVKPVRNKLSNPDEEVEFSFNFLPHKPFKTIIEFILSKPSGGRWKFKIGLTATHPDYFDVLNIVSQLNVRKTIQFRLFNSDKKVPSPYLAYYTQDSDSEFMVNPPKGILEPAINDGTIIEVSYLPTQYGKAKTGTLIIETEQNLWRFLVKGMFEKYIPPKQKN